MLTKLRLKNFKGFRDAELHLGPLTLLVGTNASGKSNIRDALRFLHGIGRGYNLADIIGEKYVEGGVLQWRGIRGGLREIAFQNQETFSLQVTFPITYQKQVLQATYSIEVNLVNLGIHNFPPSILAEELTCEGFEYPIFKLVSSTEDLRLRRVSIGLIAVKFYDYWQETPSGLSSFQPILSQIENVTLTDFKESIAWELSQIALKTLSQMRFLDLSPEIVRLPSLPGQTILGDRGENLSSVLFNICRDPQRKQALLEWIKELTPMDAQDFEFLDDFTGKILLHLVEENGQRVSAYSVSDGTLRFLALLAALLGSEPAKLYFFEELDNGIHPTRLHLLLQLIERKVTEGNIQIVATTHSPQLLRLLSPQSLESASLTYRLPNHADAKIKRILDIPDAKRLIEQGDLARLYESGWLENAVYFTEEEEEMETAS